ncbi:MAG: methylated-DNA--[protein]-cysteine S-methyltransferase [candidate division Zixibacteria bacterium]|nr:methylated-DNA--[protein]-cysteine S-methyltransferase [candidate division Zixibacteria bacterium]
MPKLKTTVRYGQVDGGDLGTVWFAESERGLWRIEFGRTKDRFLADLSQDGVEAVEDKTRTAGTRKALADYFSGKSSRFDLKVDWSRVDGFIRKALQVCAQIPHGKTWSYAEIARKAGSPGAARAVGQAMAKNPFPIVVPCHRVVKSDGSLGGFSGGLHFKRALLRLESEAVA